MFVKLWMQDDVISVTGDTTIAEADTILSEHSFRHLPVMDAEVLVGIITGSDINKAMPSTIDSSQSPADQMMLTQAKVSMFMASTPITTAPMASLESVALLMSRHKIGAMPVLEGEKLVGIITESDLLRAFAETLSGDENGVRIELQTRHNSSDLYSVIDICKRWKMQLSAITVYRDFSPQEQLITLRVSGAKIEEMVDNLWDAGIKVNQVSSD